MSEKLTSISLPGQYAFGGLMDWGERSAADMIQQVKKHAKHLREQADMIDEAADSEFQIDVVRGSLIRRHVREVQKSSRLEIHAEDRT